MRESKTLLEIGIYLNYRLQEVNFDNVIYFLIDCLSNSEIFFNDFEVSNILFDTIEFGGLTVPESLDTSRFTMESIMIIADSNFKPTYCKEKLSKELKIHEQTLNKWLKFFDEDLYYRLHNERRLCFSHLYEIVIALGFNKFSEIFNRNDLSKRCDLKGSELRKNLPVNLQKCYDKFLKYPPIFSHQVLEFFEVKYISRVKYNNEQLDYENYLSNVEIG